MDSNEVNIFPSIQLARRTRGCQNLHQYPDPTTITFVKIPICVLSDISLYIAYLVRVAVKINIILDLWNDLLTFSFYLVAFISLHNIPGKSIIFKRVSWLYLFYIIVNSINKIKMYIVAEFSLNGKRVIITTKIKLNITSKLKI